MSAGFDVMRNSMTQPSGPLGQMMPFAGTARSMAQNILLPSFFDMQSRQRPDSAAGTYEVKQEADGLRQAIAPLIRRDGQNLFNARTAVSSDTEALSVTANNPSMFTKPKEVSISQIAESQQNASTVLNSDERSLPAGRHTINIQSSGQSFNVQVNVRTGESNESVLNRMANDINEQGLNVSARVETKDGVSQLFIEGRQTGERNTFTITDRTGDLAARLGIDQVSREAQDAVFTVDGVNRTSANNTVSLGDGITATLRQATSGPVTVSVQRGQNTAAITGAVGSVVERLNSLLDSSSRAGTDFSRMIRSFSSSLSQLGITMGENGRLSLNNNTLQTALNEGRGEFLINDRNSVFNRMDNRAAAISRNAASYGPPLGYDQSGSLFGQSSADYMGLLFNGAV
jgi:flagellar hook-associated protein 2